MGGVIEYKCMYDRNAWTNKKERKEEEEVVSCGLTIELLEKLKWWPATPWRRKKGMETFELRQMQKGGT